jgi:hypothetical protein
MSSNFTQVLVTALNNAMFAQRSVHKEPVVPFVKAARKIPGATPDVPDCLRVRPDEQEQRLQQQKEKLLERLKPTGDSISKVRCFCSGC